MEAVQGAEVVGAADSATAGVAVGSEVAGGAARSATADTPGNCERRE